MAATSLVVVPRAFHALAEKATEIGALVQKEKVGGMKNFPKRMRSIKPINSAQERRWMCQASTDGLRLKPPMAAPPKFTFCVQQRTKEDLFISQSHHRSHWQ